MKVKNKNLLKTLEEKVYKIKYSDNPEEGRKPSFNIEKFKEQAKKVKKTFKDEDLLRFHSDQGIN